MFLSDKFLSIDCLKNLFFATPPAIEIVFTPVNWLPISF